MNIDDLISTFQDNQKKLKRAIEDDDDTQIAMFDDAVSRDFENILDSKPSGGQEMRQLFEFLMDQLIPDGEQSEIQAKIRKKLLNLFYDVVARDNDVGVPE